MADSDSNSDASYEDSAPPSAISLRTRRSRDTGRLESRRLSADVVPQPPKKKTYLPSNLDALETMKNDVARELCGTDYDPSTSLRVIHATLSLQEDHLRRKLRVGKAKASSVPAATVRGEVCRLFAISPPTYSKIVNRYLNHREVYASGKSREGRTGNTKQKPTRIPRSKAVQILVRQFVREKRRKYERVTANQIMDFLTQTKKQDGVTPLLVVNREDPKSYAAATRNVRRMLVASGYRRGKRNGNVLPNPANLVKRDQYLRLFFENRAKPPGERKREVYTDESYIHQHHNHFHQSVYGPSDDEDVRYGKDPHKGKRHCFCTAMQGASPMAEQLTEEALDPGQKAGLVPNSVWVFSPQDAEAHKGDHHKVFNGLNYVKWWKEKLLPNLQEPSIIITDNAAHHLVYNESVPKPAKMMKQECIDYLQSKNVTFPPNATAIELKDAVRLYIKAHEKPEIVRAAEELGHEVLFTPPHHSDFQPIELLWARVKQNIAHQYSVGVTMEMVKNRLLEQFRLVEEDGHDAVTAMIEKCARIAKSFIPDMEEDEFSDAETDSDDNSSLGSLVHDPLGAADAEEVERLEDVSDVGPYKEV